MTTIELLIVLLALAVISYIAYLIGKSKERASFGEREGEIREDAIKRSRAVLSGHFSEQLAPYLPDFPYSPTEVKFLGKPTDFIVFKGLDEKSISEVVFCEVKSGKSSLNQTERTLKQAVESGKVSFEIYRIPEDLTKRKDG